jgi:hypothetical protein
MELPAEERIKLYNSLVNIEGGLSCLQQLLKHKIESFDPVKDSITEQAGREDISLQLHEVLISYNDIISEQIRSIREHARQARAIIVPIYGGVYG